MKRLGSSLLLGLLALMVFAMPTSAARAWCSRDPVIKVDGQVVDILVSSYVEMLDTATGPVKIVITIPTGSVAEVYATDLGFGYGYDITFQHSSTLKKTATATQIKVSTYAPSSQLMPVKTDVKPRSVGPVRASNGSGNANTWFHVSTPAR